MKGDGETIPEEGVKVLDSLKKGMRLWTETLDTGKKNLKKISSNLSRVDYFALSCSKKNCHCCRESNSVEEDIESMRDEIADLKSEAGDTLLRFGTEALGTGASLAGGQPAVAIATGWCASKDFVTACETYNEAKELERRVDDLEKFVREMQDPEDNSTTKNSHWWQFWK